MRLGKPVQLFEWGVGTNTTNQIWILAGQGELHAKPKYKAGVTEVGVKIKGSFNKTNDKDDSIKIMQQAEGMTPASKEAPKLANMWGEVAMARLKSVEKEGGETMVYLEIKTAIKIGK
jgi:hypothetical protein